MKSEMEAIVLAFLGDDGQFSSIKCPNLARVSFLKLSCNVESEINIDEIYVSVT